MLPQPAKVDLHVHSLYSGPAADWILRRLEFPASCSQPRDLYHKLRAAGMTFVTLTDINSIEGCLQILDLDGVFLGEELIAHFPEDGCKVHLLLWGLTEQDHAELQQLRTNLYEVQKYLQVHNIAHAVAHALYSSDEKLTPLHAKKLVLLFRHFESLNGKHPALLSECLAWTLRNLTPQAIERFVEETAMEPTHPEPWQKIFLGGSNDSGGIYAGSTWTQTPPADSIEDFLLHIREGRAEPAGQPGSPLRSAHNTYSTAFSFAKSKLSREPRDPGALLLEKVCSRFLEGRDPTEFSLAEKLTFLAQGIASGKIFEFARAGQSSFWRELSSYFSQPAVHAALARVTAGVEEPERRAFLMADLISGQLGYRLTSHFINEMRAGRILESLQMVAPLLPMLLLLAPYLQSFRLPRRLRLQQICRSLAGAVPPSLQNRKRAWFTDTLDEINGVTTTIRKMAAAGMQAGFDITVVACRSNPRFYPDIKVQNFQPIGEFELPEYELQRLSFPPVLQILDWIEREKIDQLIISTPGPVGLTALFAAEMLGLPSASIYHTDFPQYVGILTDDAFLETLTWNYMHWFYSKQECVFVNCEDYRQCWIRRGIPADRLRILPRGLDTQLFHPCKRQPEFWYQRGLRHGETAVLFVGRISREKNLDVLVSASREWERRRSPVRLVFVGDGPYARQLRSLLPDAIFAGALHGEELATAYASADIFVFPSTTDTFGNVVLEAQASGLPCIVSDVGGPKDLVSHGADGFITRALDAGEVVQAVDQLIQDTELRQRMGRAARVKVESRDWHNAFLSFWREMEPKIFD